MTTMRKLVAVVVVAACGPASRHGGNADAQVGVDAPVADSGVASYKVYAHADHVLYSVDLGTRQLVTVGPFLAPLAGTKEDVITDLAVAPDGTIYTISETALYTASAADGHVTKLTTLAACGQKTVALTATPDGKLFTGDYSGALCEIDIAVHPPVVQPPVMMSGGLALSGDMVAVDSGTIYGTAYKLSDTSGHGTTMNNLLVKVDVATGVATTIGASGFPKLFGVAYAGGKVFGFTHDGTGRVVTIDTTTGVGTVFATLTDPMTGKAISFAGAGVNALVIE